MASEQQDDITLVPTTLDLANLEALVVDGRMEAENHTWIVLRYPVKPIKGWRWCEYTLVVNHPALPAIMAEMKNVKAILAYLGQLEHKRQFT